jgi:hypothetical protein
VDVVERSTTKPGNAGLRPAVPLVWKAGRTRFIASPLPFAVMSIVQPMPLMPAFALGSGVTTRTSIVLPAAVAAADAVARADADGEPAMVGELDVSRDVVWLHPARSTRIASDDASVLLMRTRGACCVPSSARLRARISALCARLIRSQPIAVMRVTPDHTSPGPNVMSPPSTALRVMFTAFGAQV